MKSKLFLALCLVALMPLMIFAQTAEDVQLKFENVFLGVAGAVYFILVALLKNATWLPAWLNTKLIAAIVGAIVAVVSVFVAGLPALSITAVIGLVGTLYNFVKGWVESSTAKAGKIR